MLREVAEETSQRIELGELIKIQTSHWIGRSPRADDRGLPRDPVDLPRHLPRIRREPVVVDHGGTTESARWVPLAEWRQLRWTINWQQILGELLSAGD